jgi:hypothetical protein
MKSWKDQVFGLVFTALVTACLHANAHAGFMHSSQAIFRPLIEHATDSVQQDELSVISHNLMPLIGTAAVYLLHAVHDVLVLTHSSVASSHFDTRKEAWPTIPMRRDTLYIDIGVRTGCPEFDQDVFAPSGILISTVGSRENWRTAYTGGSNLIATLLLCGGMKNRACGASVSAAAVDEVAAALSRIGFDVAVSGSDPNLS